MALTCRGQAANNCAASKRRERRADASLSHELLPDTWVLL